MNGTDGGTYATQTVESFIRASNGYSTDNNWGGAPWRTWYPQAFNYETSTNSCGESVDGVVMQTVQANPLWRDDLIQ